MNEDIIKPCRNYWQGFLFFDWQLKNKRAAFFSLTYDPDFPLVFLYKFFK